MWVWSKADDGTINDPLNDSDQQNGLSLPQYQAGSKVI
jgi:hypothetical protein